MSLFDDFAAATVELGALLVNAAEAIPIPLSGDAERDAANAKAERDAYIIARVHVVVAEALARQAVLATGDEAAKLVQAAALMIGKSEQQLIDAAAAAKAAVVEDVKEGYRSALDLGKRAVEGVAAAVDARVSQVFWTFEAQVLTAAAAIGAYLWWQSRQKQPSAASMRRALIAGGG